MDHFALLPARERAIVLRETAARLRVGSATIVEKDFWVCWAIQRVFSIATLPGPLFKGRNLAVEGLQSHPRSADCGSSRSTPERTFWEKATLLHAAFHSGKMQPRYSRHYYDLARLYRHQYGNDEITDFRLLASVVDGFTRMPATIASTKECLIYA
jgi:hypothetical protein